MASAELEKVFDEADRRIAALESALDRGEAELSATVTETVALARLLMRGHLAARAEAGGPAAEPRNAELARSEDPLDVFKAFVKGEPSLNTIRDNVRELVYYRNCLDMRREDALPAKPAAMAVRTIRHIHLYLRSRSIQEHRIEGP